MPALLTRSPGTTPTPLAGTPERVNDASAEVSNVSMTEGARANEVVITFPYSSEQHVKALDQSPEFRLAGIWFTGLGLMLMASTIAEMAQGVQSFPADWLSIMGSFAMAASGPLLPYVGSRVLLRHYRKDKRDGRTETFRFSRDGFAFSKEPAMTPWGLLATATEVKTAFLFTDALSNWPVYVPKTAMSPIEQEQLRTMLKSEFLWRPKKLKLLPAGQG
jgi:hypothetical protein